MSSQEPRQCEDREPHYYRWESDVLRTLIEAHEGEATRLMSTADGMRRVLIERGELPDPGEGDCRSIAQ